MLLQRIARSSARLATSSSSTILPRSTSVISGSSTSSSSRRSFAAAAAGDKVVLVEDFKAFSDATTTNERSVAYFTASWCPPCRTISPVFATLSSKHADVKFLKVDVDANEEAASKSNIRTIPAFHFYRKGKLVGTFAGADQKKLSEGIEDLEARP